MDGGYLLVWMEELTTPYPITNIPLSRHELWHAPWSEQYHGQLYELWNEQCHMTHGTIHVITSLPMVSPKVDINHDMAHGMTHGRQ